MLATCWVTVSQLSEACELAIRWQFNTEATVYPWFIYSIRLSAATFVVESVNPKCLDSIWLLHVSA